MTETMPDAAGNVEVPTGVETQAGVTASGGAEAPVAGAVPAPGGVRMFENDRASAGLGMKLLSISPGHAVISMTIREDMLNGFGRAHGGIIFALADTTFAAACNEDDRVTVSAGAEISFLRPCFVGQVLTATAQRRHLAGRNGIYDVQVRNETGVVAEFRGRSRITTPDPRPEEAR